MSGQYFSWFLLVFTLLELVVKTNLTIYDGTHAFIPNNHDHYIMQDISSMHEELSSDISSSLNNIKLKLRFEPAFLDFKQRPLGVPHVEKVRLINTDGNRSIDMTSISGSTVHFHSSFFEDKKIPPLGNTTFNVVFLGREEGSIESSLYIHTTEGHLKYRVKGASIYSPYRLRPIVGVKLPINTSFSPLIYMHNPHAEPIQIVEIYSSGGDFHLELPSGELEGPKDLWEISPMETKAIIRVRFHARVEQNHTAYVRIKLNNTEEILVVPLEVEVTSTACLFYPQGSLDFGVGGSVDPSKKLKLFLQNTLRRQIKIHSITSTSKSINIDYANMVIPAEGKNPKNDGFEVATLTLDWKTAFEMKDFSGKIIVKYKNGKARTEIPYYVTIVEGGLSFNSSVTKYFIREKLENLALRQIDVRNDFPTPVMLINVTLPDEAQSYFEILDFKSIVLQPKEKKTIFYLKLKQNVSLSELKLNSYILLRTNISEVEFPLMTYNGQLETLLPYRSKDNSLDLGLMSVESTKETYLLFLNKNPVSVTLKQMKTSLLSSSIDIVGCDCGDPTYALLKENFRNSSKCVRLKPSDYVIVKLTVKTSSNEGQVWGDIAVQTQFEQLSVPVHFRVAQGRLDIEPESLVFDQCFPGKICSHSLRVHSTFNDPMVIEEILSIPPDSRITSKHTGHIMAKATKVIGQLMLDPNLECQGDCYLGIPQEIMEDWLESLLLPKSTTELDINLVNTFYNRYLNLTSNNQDKWQNITLRLDTSEVKGHTFTSRVKMSWPSLIDNSNDTNSRFIFKFPLTQVGNITYQDLRIKNPSETNLIVQLVMDNFYPNADGLRDALSYDFFMGAVSTVRWNKVFFFADSFIESCREHVSVDVNKRTISKVLKPGENFTIKVGYVANEQSSDTAFIFVRNNLTVIEVVHLQGQAAYPSFKFGNRKPGALQPLLFELTEKHLKDCEKEQKFQSFDLSIKRTFTARNTGDITVYVNNFFINGHDCEGYGFRVLNCEAFALHPNKTRKIDIEFTPDFTLSKVSRTLILNTSLNQSVNYALLATIPNIYLTLCPEAIARPYWESYLYYTSLGIMVAMLISVFITALFESHRILKLALNVISRHSPATQPTLDLRLIGSQTRAEIRNPKNEEEKKPEIKPKPEEVKPPEEKYTALIPAVGKTKKKVGKTKSNEIQTKETTSEIPDASKKFNNKKFETVIKKHEPKKTLKEKRLSKKEKTEPPVEEETSSTTTECSSTHDDAKPPVKKLKNEAPSPKNEAPKIDETETTPHPKIERRKSTPKPMVINRKEFKENIQEIKTKPKLVKTHKDRKDKSFLNRKTDRRRPLDVVSNARVSPPMPVTNVWAENRASFSDVVARSESAQALVTHAKPEPIMPVLQMKTPQFVEPYCKSNVELGPIGSRREYWQDGAPTASVFQPQIVQQEPAVNPVPCHSYFSDANSLEMNLNFFSTPTDVQYTPPQESSPLLSDPWKIPNTSANYWDGILGSGINAETLPPPAPQDSCWSWGSPVWQPLSTEVTRTPTRTPPGFAPHRDLEEQRQQQEQNTYGPFSLWSNQQQNPWKYPHNQ